MVKLFIISRAKKNVMAGKIKFMNKIIMSHRKKIIGLKMFDEEIFPVIKIKFIINGRAELIKFISWFKKFLVIEKECLKEKNKWLMIII